MLSKILTVAIFFTLIGCDSKEYKKEDNSGVSYAESLNEGRNADLITELSTKKDILPRETYYLASAYSGAGGIDVFSLYSVLELQLFRKSSLNWSDLSNDFKGVEWTMVYMNVLWNTYEAIPILKKLSQLDSKNQENITKALVEYKKLLKDSKFKEVARKNMLVLSAVSLL